MRYGNISKSKSYLWSRLMLVLVTILFIFMTRAAWNIHKKAQISLAKYNQSLIELEKLKDKSDNLSASVAWLSTEKGIEAELRSKYHAVAIGESVAVIIEDEKVPTTSSSSILGIPNIPWYRRILNSIGF